MINQTYNEEKTWKLECWNVEMKVIKDQIPMPKLQHNVKLIIYIKHDINHSWFYVHNSYALLWPELKPSLLYPKLKNKIWLCPQWRIEMQFCRIPLIIVSVNSRNYSTMQINLLWFWSLGPNNSWKVNYCQRMY